MLSDAGSSAEPVVAELITAPAAVSPLRFGLRTLMAIMAVCSVQFALMSYLGVFGGLLTGAAVCCAAFSGVLLVGMFLFQPGYKQRVRQLDRVIVWLMLSLVCVGAGTMVAGGAAVVLAAISQVRSEAWLRAQVGLSVRQTIVSTGANAQSALEIRAVFPGSPADAAGIKSGDYIINYENSHDLLRTLQKSRGKQVELEISTPSLPGMIGPSPRTVPLDVPKSWTD